MGDEQSKDGHQDLMTSVDDSNEENISNERCPRESTYHRANLNRRVPYNSHVCDSGGESDTHSSSSSSGTRSNNRHIRDRTNGTIYDKRITGRSNNMNIQTSQMSNFSASVPDISNACSQNERPKEDVRKLDQRSVRGDTRPRSQHMYNTNTIDVYQVPYVQSEAHNISYPQHRTYPKKSTHSSSIQNQISSSTQISSNQEQKYPMKVDSSGSQLVGSQQVFSSNLSSVNQQTRNPEVSTRKNIPRASQTGGFLSDISIGDAVMQFQQMQQALRQLQDNSNQILQEMDNEERENEEWLSVLNKKASVIECRLQRLEDKSTEDESTLTQLSDIVKSVSSKLDEIETMVTTLSGQDAESMPAPIVKSIPVETILTSPLVESVPQRTPSSAEPDPNEDSDLIESNIDLSTLPDIAKDHKGYKDRRTERRRDNRREMRREKRTKGIKVKSSEEQNIPVDGGARPSVPNIRNSEVPRKALPQKTAKRSHPQPSRQRLPPDRAESTNSLESGDSLLDSRDDYRNLAVVASGEKVLSTVQQETIVDSEQFWMSLIQREKVNATRSTLQKGDGSESYLILDTSDSMKGQPFSSMIQTAKTFINGICDNAETTQESMGIIEVGQTTRVLVHLTKERDKLLSPLGQLRPGGMSPIMGGLFLAKELLKRINCKIVVISDGKMTPINIKAGEDLPDIDNEHLKVQTILLGHSLKEINGRVFFVPVGPYDSSFMEDIVRETRGDEVLPADIGRLCNWTRNALLSLQLGEDFKKQHPGVSFDSEVFKAVLDQVGSLVNLGTEEKNDMIKVASETDNSRCNHIECDPNMPPIGTRVRRGPDWRWQEQDLDMAGTVVSHTKNGHIWIEWDYGTINIYRYGNDGCYDVVTSEDTRLLSEDQLIAVGCVVRRGKDWKHGNTEDGGAGKFGAVFIVNDNGSIQVRWSNRNMGLYMFGQNGCFEVEICDPGQHGLQLESMVASGGDPSPVDTELSTPPWPKVSTVEEEEDIDPTVAEMNRRNAQRTQQQTEKEVKSSENIQHVKSSENIHNVKSSDNIQHQSKDGVKRTADKVTDEQNIVMGSSPSQSGARRSQSHASGNSNPLRLRDSDSQADIPDTQTPARLKHKLQKSTDKKRTERPDRPEAKDASASSDIEIIQEGQGIWQYKDGYAGWKLYAKEQSDKLEKGYCHHPKGASLLIIGKSSYRILFSTFKQINAKTKEMIDIRRLLPAS